MIMQPVISKSFNHYTHIPIYIYIYNIYIIIVNLSKLLYGLSYNIKIGSAIESDFAFNTFDCIEVSILSDRHLIFHKENYL